MSKQLLYTANVGPCVEQVGGEAVPQRVRTRSRIEADLRKVFLQQPADAANGQAAATVIQEYGRLFSNIRGQRFAARQPLAYRPFCGNSKQGQSLALAFAANDYGCAIQVQ